MKQHPMIVKHRNEVMRMSEILQDLPIRAPLDRVFGAVSTSYGLNQWWTETCTGEPTRGSAYELGFGPAYQWRATVTQSVLPVSFELTLTHADPDWISTRVRFDLAPNDGGTRVQFSHRGWPATNEHYRVSSHCWALYLRLLRRYIEFGESIPYAERLDV